MAADRAGESDRYAAARQEMVGGQLRARGITDQQVLEMMVRLPRHLFVPSELRSEAYEDHPVPIGLNQTISQPFIVAYMTEQLRVDADDVVLEIGTGSGYQTAVLAGLCRWVFTVERLVDLSHRARALLEALEIRNVSFSVGDGAAGWLEHAPFDAILVTAASDEVPSNLLNQLAPDGILIMPVGPRNHQVLTRFWREGNGGSWQREALMPVRFVPLLSAPS
jgi:protein-L-isoaspartate(D-aspartate) O-methyltransferase